MSRTCLREGETCPRRMHTYLMQCACLVSSNPTPPRFNPSAQWDHWPTICPNLVLFIIAEMTSSSSIQVPEGHSPFPRPIFSSVSIIARGSGLKFSLIASNLRWLDISSSLEPSIVSPLWRATSPCSMMRGDASQASGPSPTPLHSSDLTYHHLPPLPHKWRLLNSWKLSPTLNLPGTSGFCRGLRNEGRGRKATPKGGYGCTGGSARTRPGLQGHAILGT